MLTVRNLHCSYGTAEILSGVEFDLELGEVLAILGRNGIGKTTLVRAVAGLRPPTITSGEVIYRGSASTRWRATRSPGRGSDTCLKGGASSAA